MALALPLAACSGGGGESADGSVEITYLTQNAEANVAAAEALIEAFEAENPDITVKLETQPAGTEGDNLIKTKLSTGEMEDVFHYNSGSLFQALNPDQNLVPLDDDVDRRPHRHDDGRRLDRQRHLRRTVGRDAGRRGRLQQGDLRRARPRDPDDVGRVRREQRGDQGRRHHPRHPDLRRHLDEPAVRARRLRQRAGRRPRLGRGVHRERPQVRRRAGARRASRTSRRASRRAGGTRTSARRCSTTAPA